METIKKLNNSEYEISIKLNEKEVTTYIEKALEDQIKKVKEPGFRPGKMPKNMFLKKYGVESAYPTAIDLIINDIYPKIVEDNKLNTIDYPEFDWNNVVINEKEFSVTGKVAVMPEFELPNIEEIKKTVEKEKIKVTTAEVEKEIENLAAKDAVYEDQEDDYEAQNGDVTVIDFEGFKDGVAFEGGKGEGHSLTLGSNTFIPGFEEQLIGTKKGESKDIEVTFPEDYQAEDLAGKPVVFKCKVNAVKKREIPTLSAKQIKEMPEFKATTKAELKKEIKENIEKQREAEVNAKYEKELVAKYVEAIDLIVPQAMINQETEHAIKNIEQNFKAQGFELEMYLQMTGSNLEEFKKQIDVESKERIEMHLLVDKVMKTEKIKVTDKEVKERLAKIIEDYKMEEEEVIKQLGGTTDPIQRDLQFEKARDILFK